MFWETDCKQIYIRTRLEIEAPSETYKESGHDHEQVAQADRRVDGLQDLRQVAEQRSQQSIARFPQTLFRRRRQSRHVCKLNNSFNEQ